MGKLRYVSPHETDPLTIPQYKKEFERLTGFEFMDQEPGETFSEAINRNVTWIRDHAEECAQAAERAEYQLSDRARNRKKHK